MRNRPFPAHDFPDEGAVRRCRECGSEWDTETYDEPPPWKCRRTPLKRGSPPERRTPLKPVGKRRKRQRASGEVYGPQAAYCRERACVVCGSPPPSDPHHEPPRSLGGNDEDTVPLCRGDHRLRHELGSAEAFEEATGVDLLEVVKEMRQEEAA